MPTTISPDMSLPIPDVGTDPGPDWATNLNSCLTIIDGHTHTSGSGVPITSDAIDINADLPMNDNDLITIRSTRFTPQSAVLNGAADLGCLYEVNDDLYYNDGAGNNVRITQSGSVAGASGTITGLPSGTASASFSGTTFSWQSATNTPASMNQGPTKIRQAVANGYGVTLTASGSQVADYGFTLPVSLPTVNSFIRSDSSGNLIFVPVGANIRASEGAGTVTLTSSDNPWQVFNTSAAVVCVLPSVGIAAGQCIKIENVGSGGTLEVQSSNTNTLCYVNSLYSSVSLVALQATPTTSAHWKVNFSYNENQYVSGTTYYNSIDPAVTSSASGFVLDRGVFVPYQLQSGVWRCKMNLAWRMTGTSSYTVTTAGLVYKSATNFAQAFGFRQPGGTLVEDFFTSTNTGTFTANVEGSVANGAVSADVELNSKPTWAY